MTFDELQELADKDLKLNDTELDIESLKTPALHNKYCKFHNQYVNLLKKAEQDRDIMIRDKWEYYTGKSSPEVYQEKPFDLKILKADVAMYIEADSEYQEIGQKEEYIKMMVEYTERVLKEINTRNWTIRNTIEWKKFLHGD